MPKGKNIQKDEMQWTLINFLLHFLRGQKINLNQISKVDQCCIVVSWRRRKVNEQTDCEISHASCWQTRTELKCFSREDAGLAEASGKMDDAGLDLWRKVHFKFQNLTVRFQAAHPKSFSSLDRNPTCDEWCRRAGDAREFQTWCSDAAVLCDHGHSDQQTIFRPNPTFHGRNISFSFFCLQIGQIEIQATQKILLGLPRHSSR